MYYFIIIYYRPYCKNKTHCIGHWTLDIRAMCLHFYVVTQKTTCYKFKCFRFFSVDGNWNNSHFVA